MIWTVLLAIIFVLFLGFVYWFYCFGCKTKEISILNTVLFIFYVYSFWDGKTKPIFFLIIMFLLYIIDLNYYFLTKENIKHIELNSFRDILQIKEKYK